MENLLRSGNQQIDEILRSVCECDAGDRLNIGGEGDVIAREFGLEGHILQIRATDEEVDVQRSR